MAITRTAKGTASDKSSSATLTISGLDLEAGDFLIVGLGYEEDFGNPDSVKWGKRRLKIISGTPADRGDTRCRLYRARIRHSDTRNLVATWTGVTGNFPKVMFATALKEVSQVDIATSAGLAGSTSHNTGSAGTSTDADTISIGAFVTGGPQGDTAGSAGSGHTLGQRVGTTGGGPATNITIQETFEILSATGPIQASLTGITSRICACCVAALKPSQTYEITDAWYQSFDGNPNSESVILVVRNEADDNGFQVRIDREEFEEMTDDQVRDKVRDACAWWTTKQVLNEESPDFTPDTAFNTRIDSFKNETFAF